MKQVHVRIREGRIIYHGPVGNFSEGPTVIVLPVKEAADQIDAGNVDLVNSKDVEALKIQVSKPDTALEEMEKQMNFYKSLAQDKKESKSIEEENKALKNRLNALESKLLDLMEKLDNKVNDESEIEEDLEDDNFEENQDDIEPEDKKENLSPLDLLLKEKKSNKKKAGVA